MGLLYTEGEYEEIIRLNSNETYNYINLLECNNPFCGCGNCQLVFLAQEEYQDENSNGIPIAIDLSNEKVFQVDYSLTKIQKQKSLEFINLLREQLDNQDWELLRKKQKIQKEEFIFKVNLNEIDFEYEFPKDHFLDESLMISYQSIFPQSELFKVKDRNKEYVILDHYCKNIKCDCTEINLQVFEKTEPRCINNFMYNYEQDTTEKLDENKWIVKSLKENYIGFIERIKIRDLRTKNLFAKNRIKMQQYQLEKQNKTLIKREKIGRNDKCPCGSGKKYKKCCGK